MFEVYIKTKKAVPGLAKVLLIIILLGSIIFAWFVQKSKLTASELKLDKQTQARTSAGKITFGISSSWQKIDTQLLPDNTIMGWRSKSNRKTNVRIYAAYQGKSDIVGKLRVIAMMNQLFPAQNAFVEPRYVKSSALPACVGEGAVVFDQQILALYMRVMFLPNGSSFAIVFIGDRAMANSFVLWDKQISQTIKYFPEKHIKKVSAGQEISIGSLSFKLPNDSWVAKDKYFDLLTIQPAVTDSSKLWIANLKAMRLPKYRKSKELLVDHFISLHTIDKTVAVSKLSTTKRFVTYFAQDSDSITIDKEKYVYSELCWLSRARSNDSIFISVNCEQGVGASVRKQINKTLETLTITKNQRKSAPKRVDAVKVISKYNPARQAGKIPGWYLINTDKKPIGFDALLCSTLSRNEQITIAGLDYTYFDGGSMKYTQREQWEVSAKDFTGRYSTRIELRNRKQRVISSHLIIANSEFSADKIHTVVRIDDRVNNNEFARPKEFLPEGGALILISMMADNSWSDGDSVVIAQMNTMNSHIQTGVFKRVKHADYTEVLVLADNELSYTKYKFDNAGRWVGIDIDTDVKIIRTSAKKVALLYRMQVREALRFFMQMEKSISNEKR